MGAGWVGCALCARTTNAHTCVRTRCMFACAPASVFVREMGWWVSTCHDHPAPFCANVVCIHSRGPHNFIRRRTTMPNYDAATIAAIETALTQFIDPKTGERLIPSAPQCALWRNLLSHATGYPPHAAVDVFSWPRGAGKTYALTMFACALQLCVPRPARVALITQSTDLSVAMWSAHPLCRPGMTLLPGQTTMHGVTTADYDWILVDEPDVVTRGWVFCAESPLLTLLDHDSDRVVFGFVGTPCGAAQLGAREIAA